MNEALTNAERLKKFLKDSLGWFILGMAIAGIGWKIQYNRSSQLEELLTTTILFIIALEIIDKYGMKTKFSLIDISCGILGMLLCYIKILS